MEEVIITADIHLLPDDNHPINQNFYHFLNTQLTHCSKLYLIGDVFESWVGDDINLPEYQTVISLFKKLTDNGLAIYLMYGNRDFLMGNQFWQATGIIKLDETIEININHQQIILVHGDQLCTDDVAYQKMRKWVRNPIIQWLFLTLPKSKRINIGNKMREQSRQHSSAKSVNIMDVNQQTVENLFLQHPDCNHLIHGHTHQPAHHRFTLNGKLKQRWVLGDWQPNAKYISIKTDIQFKTSNEHI